MPALNFAGINWKVQFALILSHRNKRQVLIRFKTLPTHNYVRILVLLYAARFQSMETFKFHPNAWRIPDEKFDLNYNQRQSSSQRYDICEGRKLKANIQGRLLLLCVAIFLQTKKLYHKSSSKTYSREKLKSIWIDVNMEVWGLKISKELLGKKILRLFGANDDVEPYVIMLSFISRMCQQRHTGHNRTENQNISFEFDCD